MFMSDVMVGVIVGAVIAVAGFAVGYFSALSRWR
jgi:hypothetical protein